MRCVVTGGCGFIGSHLVDQLLRLGHEVIVVDDLSNGKLENLNKNAKLIKASILDFQLVKSVMAGADWVFHVAAWARVVRSIEDPIGTHNVNVTGTLNVLQAAREGDVKKFIYSSSSSVYGDQPTHIMTEDMIPNPKSPYALHKLMGEQYTSLFARLFNMTCVSLRYFNVYGPRQITEGTYALVIGKFLRLRDEGKPLTVFGDGKQTRAYTYVTDVVRANVLAAQAELAHGENLILNIGTSQEVSVKEVAQEIGGKVIHVIPNPRGELEERRKVADYTRARTLLGWEPMIPLVEGLKSLL